MFQDKIILKGMEFYGYHGVLAEERRLGQKFVIDLTMFCSLKEAGVADDLEKTVSYADVFAGVKEIVEGRPFALIEALAENIAVYILEHFQVSGVTVKVKKPQAPISGQFKYAAVEITRGV